MQPKRIWAVSALLLGLSCAASADITDPAMGMDAGSLSIGILQFTGFIPNQIGTQPDPGGGVIGLFNDTGSIVSSIDFRVFIKPGLAETLVDSAFVCNGANNPALPNPFFATCTLNYNSNSGQLDFLFAGGPGIPLPNPGCNDANKDDEGCSPGPGHFIMTLNDGFDEDPRGSEGGWLASDDALFNGAPDITIGAFTTAPEPSTLLLSGTAVLGVACLTFRRRRHFSRSN